MVAVTSLPLFFLLYLTVSFMRSWQGVKKKVWIGWFLGCVALMLIYPVFFWATHFYARYTSPILVVMLPISSIAVAAAMMNFKLVSSNHNRIIAFFGFILIGINVALATLSLHTGRIGNSHSLSAGYVRDHLPTSAVVGAFQSGVIGYFNENIINLDGKVNPKVLDALSRGQVNEYVIEYNIEYVIDWVDIVTKSFLTIPNAWAIWEKCKAIVPNGESLCIQRVR